MRTRTLAAVAAAAALPLLTAPTAFADQVVNQRVEVTPDAAVDVVVDDAVVGTSVRVDLAGDQDPYLYIEQGGEDEHLLCTTDPQNVDEPFCVGCPIRQTWLISAATPRPRRPGTTSKVTAVPTDVVRLPSRRAVQWKKCSTPSSPRTVP
jgi:hypothetical protein